MYIEPPVAPVSPQSGTICVMKVNQYPSIFVLLTALAFPAFSQNPAPAAGDQGSADQPAGEPVAQGATSVLPHMETLSSETNQVSYSIGVNLARNLQQNYPRAGIDFLILAIRDVYEGKPPRLSEDVLNASIVKYSQEAGRIARERVENLAESNLESAESFLNVNGRKEGVVTTPTGLQYRVISTGTGPKPSLEGSATINYTTRLANGDIIDSTVVDGVKPVSVNMATTIPAWREALSQMPLGSKWEIYSHPKLAYGANGAKNIGPNELLIFSIEVVAVE